MVDIGDKFKLGDEEYTITRVGTGVWSIPTMPSPTPYKYLIPYGLQTLDTALAVTHDEAGPHTGMGEMFILTPTMETSKSDPVEAPSGSWNWKTAREERGRYGHGATLRFIKWGEDD